jgi:hypothetical protein
MREMPEQSDSASLPVRLDERQERIHRRLLLIDPGPAAFFRDAAGHSSLAIMSIYTHVATGDDGETGDLFNFTQAQETGGA